MSSHDQLTLIQPRADTHDSKNIDICGGGSGQVSHANLLKLSPISPLAVGRQPFIVTEKMAKEVLTDPFTSTDPFVLFDRWLAAATEKEPINPDAMCLATQNEDGTISSRMVLLKSHGPDGFVFYTNLDSRKAVGLRHNVHASLCFYWRALGRQVTVDGRAQLVDDAQADAYFASRERTSQIGAWASKQSAPLESRAALEALAADYEAKFAGRPVPRPANWSGYRVVPQRIEFWHARDGRLHDRLVFLNDAGGWRPERLFP